MNRFPDFGKELRRSFEVHENCFDCAELYHGCNARPENPDTRCADYLRLPDVMPGTTGQVLPPSRMQGRKEPQVHGGVARARDHYDQQAKERQIESGREYGRGKTVKVPVVLPEPIEGRARDQAGKAVGVSGKPKARICGCGVPLPKGKRLCDACRSQNRRQSKRDYMRTYMEQRRSAEVGSDSDTPFPATATHATQASGGDLRASGQWEGGASLDQTSVLTESFP